MAFSSHYLFAIVNDGLYEAVNNLGGSILWVIKNTHLNTLNGTLRSGSCRLKGRWVDRWMPLLCGVLTCLYHKCKWHVFQIGGEAGPAGALHSHQDLRLKWLRWAMHANGSAQKLPRGITNCLHREGIKTLGDQYTRQVSHPPFSNLYLALEELFSWLYYSIRYCPCRMVLGTNLSEICLPQSPDRKPSKNESKSLEGH